jgi:hypothetical protein
MPILSIILGQILPRAHGNFEQQYGVLESFIIINNYYNIIIIYYCYFKNYYMEKENRIVESILVKPVQATNNFSLLLVYRRK